MLTIAADNSVSEIPSNLEPLDWTWLGDSYDRQDLYNKLIQAGWRVDAGASSPTVMVVKQ